MEIELIEIDHSATPSTKYKMEDSFQNYFALNVQASENDKLLIKATPECVVNMWLTDTNPLGLSFTKTNIKHLYVASEGVNGGRTLHKMNDNFLTCKSVNKLLYSEELNLSNWSSGLSKDINEIASPVGTLTAERIYKTALEPQYLSQNISGMLSEEGVWTFSAYVKKDNCDYVAIRIQIVYPARIDCVFNLTTGKVHSKYDDTIDVLSATIEYITDGWYRVSVSTYAPSADICSCYVSPNYNGNSIDTTDTINGASVFAWGLQMEPVPWASEYIYTNNAVVPRDGESPHNMYSIIQNYTDACRTTYKNRKYGLQNLLFEKDGSGRILDVLPPKTIEFKNSGGGYIETGVDLAIQNFSVVQAVEDEYRCITRQADPLEELSYIDGQPGGTYQTNKEGGTIQITDTALIGYADTLDRTSCQFYLRTLPFTAQEVSDAYDAFVICDGAL